MQACGAESVSSLFACFVLVSALVLTVCSEPFHSKSTVGGIFSSHTNIIMPSGGTRFRRPLGPFDSLLIRPPYPVNCGLPPPCPPSYSVN